MTDKKWDDKQIEELLDNIPDMQDNRSKSDILARLKQDERLNAPRRRKRKRWIPALVAVAALLVIRLLVPSMLRQNEGAMELRMQSIIKWRKAKPQTGSHAEDSRGIDGVQ